MAEDKQPSVRLSDLGLHANSGADPLVSGLAVDSRNVKPGFLFAALPGSNIHGGEFVGYALRMGAGAVLTDREGAALAREALGESDAALIVAENPREALAHAAALWFRKQPETCVAITGTNGKTSVSSFCRQIWMALGFEAVNLGTTGVEGSWTFPLNHTTPEPIVLHKVLAEAAEAGVTHLAMEASSHGLDQHRLDGVQLAAAGFTNFSQDHLDYHETFEAYFAAKMRLFNAVLPPNAPVVVNCDDPKSPDVIAVAKEAEHPVICVGETPGCDLQIGAKRYNATGQTVLYSFDGARYEVRLNLIGGFQADNVALAVGLVIATGVAPDVAFGALPQLTTVHGRMELAGQRDNGATVFVDYAHTPASVSTAIQALRPHVLGRIIAIVGAGGDRDRSKRALMGEAAAKHADAVIITDDNPRSEDPAEIRASVLEGALRAADAQYVTEIGDRAEAILRGVDALQPGDALIVCGKGHETGQTVGDVVYPFDDLEQASIAIAALDGKL